MFPMRHLLKLRRNSVFGLGVLALLPLASCDTTSSLTSLNANVPAAAAISQPQASASETLKLAASEAPASPEVVDAPAVARPPEEADAPATSPNETPALADAPAQPAPVQDPEPVAQPKPAPSSPPATLTSVPRTPVGNRPTNQIMMVRTTAYSHHEADHLKYGRKSAAGNTLQYGPRVRSAAADWSKYPLGTRFMIEGLPYEYVVDDYGSALVGTETIDIYKPDLRTMGAWGVRNVPIRVLEWGDFEESRRILDQRKNARGADHVRKMLRDIETKSRKGEVSAGRNA
jgi:3D (Asp-Asp-Asp) domain-containing protein